MVSLHHMLDDIIINTIKNIKRILKNDGLVIIKEHDCSSKIINNIINWEHHLYHIMLSENITESLINEYLENLTSNYKSYIEINNIFQSNGFKKIVKLDRDFKEIKQQFNINNPTNLYWSIYKNI